MKKVILIILIIFCSSCRKEQIKEIENVKIRKFKNMSIDSTYGTINFALNNIILTSNNKSLIKCATNRPCKRILIKYLIYAHQKLNGKRVDIDYINFYHKQYGRLYGIQMDQIEKKLLDQRYLGNISKLDNGKNYDLIFPIMKTGDSKSLSYHPGYIEEPMAVDDSNIVMSATFIGYSYDSESGFKNGLFKVNRINHNDIKSGGTYIEIGDTITVDLYYYGGFF